MGGIELALIRNELAGEIGRDCLLECVVEDIWVEGFLCDGFEVEGGRVDIVGQHHINSQNIMAEQVSSAKISERAEEGYVFDSAPLLSLRMTTDNTKFKWSPCEIGGFQSCISDYSYQCILWNTNVFGSRCEMRQYIPLIP